jgi:hypothetical protein
MQKVHNIADFVLNASNKSQLVIKKIFSEPIGREVANIIIYLKQPLANVSDLTKLQIDYLVYANGNLSNIKKGEVAKEKFDVSGEKMTVKDLIENFGVNVE